MCLFQMWNNFRTIHVFYSNIVISHIHAGLMLFPLILSKIYITIYDNEVHVNKVRNE